MTGLEGPLAAFMPLSFPAPGAQGEGHAGDGGQQGEQQRHIHQRRATAGVRQQQQHADPGAAE